MDIAAFRMKFDKAVLPGMIFQNPGGGTSKVLSVKNGRVSYVREKSTMVISLEVMFDTYLAYKGLKMSSSELKNYMPAIFDSEARPAGHNCNSSFLFLTLRQMALASEILGKGVRGNPFFVQVNA